MALFHGFVGPRFTSRGPINAEDLARLGRAIHRRREPVSNWRVWWVEVRS